MSTYPLVITQHSKSDSWLFDDAAEGTEALRDACVAGVLEDEVFYQFGELPQRMQKALMDALRNGETGANNATIGHIMRAAFERAVNEALEMRVARIEAEAMLGEDRE